ncbi:class I adenylate-forming enzyme family protein [Rhodococcus koreensis]|uniref:Fatty-acyl-CoA synthase n=1 Tax=Rhodococcus koreensis TaxID=99653 RepID=A0A1H5BSB3_9NOCA|nr:class I adenylate-forming enzyme family protein [Rhodococcus koreensis]SED56944.1 fatty-acyl-CoA synthase [Rhodococcus koreensis]
MTAADTPLPASISEIIQDTSRQRRSQPAVIDEQGELSHGQLAESVAATAAGLRAIGVGPGTRVGLLCTNRREWLVATYAAITVGATVAAFATWSRRWDLDHLLTHSRCEVLITVDGFGPTDLMPTIRELVPEAWSAAGPGWRSVAYPALRGVVIIGNRVPAGAYAFRDLGEHRRGSAASHIETDTEGTALVLYTSGSTSRPKAVRLGQHDAIDHAREVAERMGITPEDRIVVPIPLFWSYGGANALMVALVTGCTIVLQDTFDAVGVLEQIERYQCTAIYTLPSITRSLLANPGFSRARTASLRRGMTIGPDTDVRAAAEELGVTDICNAYGSTEMYGGATVTPHDWPLEMKCSTQGPPLAGNLVSIIDPETGAELPAGKVGEITVSGFVSSGYLDQPDETAAAFTEVGAFRTGDLGQLDDEGRLHFAGRASEMIRTGGINVSPLEVEDFLLTHDEVLEAAVVGIDDSDKDQVPIGFVRVDGSAIADEAALVDYCRHHIASYKVPVRIVMKHNELPRTLTGKLIRNALLDEAKEVWASSDNTKEYTE